MMELSSGLHQDFARTALAAYRATKTKDAAIQMMLNNIFLDKATCLLLWEAIDAVYDDIYCVQWHSEQPDVECE